MTFPSLPNIDQKNTLIWLILVSLVITSLVVIILFFPFRFVFEFDPDEGVELIKALLYSRGHELYNEIYNDQPPLFTIVLSVIFKLFDEKVIIGRITVLSFSVVLISASMVYLRLFWGVIHAFTVVGLILLVPYYIRLSVSVMIGLPAVSLAMVAFLFLSLWHRNQERKYIIFSAAFLSLSVFTKLITIVLVPIFALGILLQCVQIRKKLEHIDRAFLPFGVWLLAFLGLSAILGKFLVGFENLSQLLEIHSLARSINFFQQLATENNLFNLLKPSWGILFLGALGALTTIIRRKWTALYLVAWILAGIISLAITVPVWYHHTILITVPAAILGAIFVGEIVVRVRKNIHERDEHSRKEYTAIGLGLCAIALVIYTRIPPIFNQLSPRLTNIIQTNEDATPDTEVLALIGDHAGDKELMITDRPMFAFRARISVPPNLALFSGKRLYTGVLTEDDVIESIETIEPGIVLLARFPLGEVEHFLNGSYKRIYYYNRYRLYVR